MKLPPKPEYIHNLEFVRNLTPYVLTSQIVEGRSVLDAGCGFGQGAWLMFMSNAECVMALDMDESRIRRASGFCGDLQGCYTAVMDTEKIGSRDHNFQVATCFDVIEHVPNPDMLLSELRRVLCGDGVLILTTPNRAVRLFPLQRPWNPEHLREYSLRTLQRALRKHFPSFAVLGIYGAPEEYEFYRNLWRPSAIRAYFGWGLRITRIFTPPSVREWTAVQLGLRKPEETSSDITLMNMAVPVPNPQHWPFYIGDVSKHCLHFLAICGFDERIIQRAVKGLYGQNEEPLDSA